MAYCRMLIACATVWATLCSFDAALPQHSKARGGDALTEEERAEDALTAAMLAPWSGDLDGMVERGYVRIGVGNEPVFFSYDSGEQQGLSVDSAREFEKYLRATLGAEAATLTVSLAPLPRDRMIDALVEGRVDLLAANLTITPERARRVDFSAPTLRDVAEIVVTGPAAPEIATLDDLAAISVQLRPSSSYHEHLAALNAERVADDRLPIPIVAANENLEDFDLAELVDVGVIPAIIVDDHKAKLYAQVFDNITLHPEIAVHTGGQIAWAMRKESPQLMAAVNGYQAKATKGTEIGNILFKRWLSDADRVKNAIAPGEDAKFEQTIGFIRKYAATYDFDPILIAAQGYQESGLDQSVRSDAGAIGIMQLLPSTAADPNVGIPNIEVADRNVEAGVKYLRFLREKYFSEPGMGELDRALFTFAAYNAGPGSIRKARTRAEAMGLNPDVWFGNVEVSAARTISREPVVYVRNILKYYTAYNLFQAAGGGSSAAARGG
jgi:membrane-bound lytic murein transglycosylase MltF